MAHTLTRLPRGSDSQFGFKKESIYGTAVVVDKFLEAFSLGLVPNPRPIEPKGWKPGLRGKRHDADIAWVDGGAGAIGLEVPRAGSLGLWQAAFGGSNTCAIQGAGPAYLATFSPGAFTVANGCSLTMQLGVPMSDGTVEPHTYSGCFIPSWKVSCEAGGILEATFDVVAKAFSHTADLAVPTYAAAPTYFAWPMQPNVKRAGTTLPGVRSASVSVESGLNTERRLWDGAGAMALPLETELRSCTLELEVEPTSMAINWDDIADGTMRAWVVELVGTTAIAATYYPTYRLTIAAGKVIGDPISVDGPDEVLQKLTIEARDNGTDPLYKLEIMTTDTTIP